MHKDGLHEDKPSPGAATSAGQAALLLVESLIHELVAIDILPLGRAIAVVDVAVDTAGEIALSQMGEQSGDDPVGPLLQAIAHTLSLDADDQTAVRAV